MDTIKFLGASVIGFTSSSPGGDSSAYVNVDLVEDLRSGDSFNSGVIGTPYRFICSGLTFDGILQRVERRKAVGQGETYNVQIVAPNEILDGCKVILSSYNGSTSQIPNLFNVYGYWEYTNGFGGSLINDTGMVWDSNYLNVSGNPFTTLVLATGARYGIRPGIEAIQTGVTTFGSGIYYKNHKYVVNFSGLPTPPSYYRVLAGDATSISELVNIVCKDGGNDYVVKLNAATGTYGPHTIYFSTKSRRNPSPLGKISEFINSRSGLKVLEYNGREMRNEDTCIFIVGADTHRLMLQEDGTKILPFWGLRTDGLPILGSGVGSNYSFHLNSYAISDITGSNEYGSSLNELDAALGGFDSWAGYVKYTKPTFANALGLVSAWSKSNNIPQGFAHDFIDEGRPAALQFGKINTDDTWNDGLQRIYNFVLQHAQQYYGKKFLVDTQFQSQVKIEAETGRIVYSWEPTNSAFVADGATPLGLTTFNQDYFNDYDGNLQSFVKYPNAYASGDLTSITDGNTIVQSTNLFVKSRVLDEFGILFKNTYGSANSCVVLEVETPFYEKAADGIGGVSRINDMFGINNSYWANIRTSNLGKVHPRPLFPESVAIPMRSNESSYGPWYSGSIAGKVDYRKIDDLAPWNYGGYDFLDTAAVSILENFVAEAQFEETGVIEIAGLPEKSLGESLVPSGAFITDISVKFGTNGVTTTYVMRTFTPRMGNFSYDYASRIKRLGTNYNNLRKNIRQIYRENFRGETALSNNPYVFMGTNVSNAIKRTTPHPAIVGYLIQDPNNSGNYIPIVGTQTFEETVSNIRVDDTAIYQATACGGMETIFRPAIVGSGSSLSTMSAVENPSVYVQFHGAINTQHLNPFRPGCDMEWVTWNDSTTTYSGLHVRKNYGGNMAQARAVVPRGPAMLTGWGYNWAFKPIPNGASGVSPKLHELSASGFANNYLKNSKLWKTGPVSLYWNDWRKVWDIPTTMRGVTDTTIPANSTGVMSVWINGQDTGDNVIIHNYFDTDISSSTKVIVASNLNDSLWDTIAVNCP